MIKKKKDTIKALAINAKDVGSTEVQIGLLTDKVKPQYEKLGVLSYAELEDNFNIDWADMSKPYETQEEIEKAISGSQL